MLVDIRHKPNSNDIQMYDWCIEYGFNPVIIATKEDKVKRSQKAETYQGYKADFKCGRGYACNSFFIINKNGRDEIMEYIDLVCERFNDEKKSGVIIHYIIKNYINKGTSNFM